MSEVCRYCGDTVANMACRSTGEMEERRQSKQCFAALMFMGGGERTEYQRLAAQLQRSTCPPERMIAMSEGPTAQSILDSLIAGCDNTMIWASELALSTGARRCDFWTIAPWQSKGYLATAYEIKVSRADFKRDTYAKQREARLFSDRFYYATPPSLLRPDEVPDWAGLIEVTSEDRKIVVPAPLRDKDAPSWELIVSLLRNSGQIRRDADLVRKERDRLRRMLKDASERIRAAGKEPWQLGVHV